MKRFLFWVMIFVHLILFSACRISAPTNMKFNDIQNFDIRSVKPENGKAALVVARTSNFAGAAQFDTHLGKKMIGVTQWKCYFIKTDVNPGVSYVISRYGNEEVAKINFEPGRVYYLLQIPRWGKPVAHISAMLLTPEDLLSTMDNGCKLLTYDTNHPGKDLSDKDYRKAVSDYEREVKEGRHNEHEGYRGVPAK